MFRFTIRDVLWLTVVVALAVGWWLEHTHHQGTPWQSQWEEMHSLGFFEWGDIRDVRVNYADGAQAVYDNDGHFSYINP